MSVIFFTDENGHRRFQYSGSELVGYVNPNDWVELFMRIVKEQNEKI